MPVLEDVERAVDEIPDLDRAVDVLRGRTLAILSGAGVSTDSGIPDYRGRGTPVRTPMSFQQFVADEGFRRRYWAGSHLGWRRFAAAGPNAGHRAITDLESAGTAVGVVTQNVDGLHIKAGTRRVVEVHGSMASVQCLDCRQSYARESIAGRLEAANPWLASEGVRELSPDGDVAIAEVDRMIVPECTVCGGVLKPNVVFFGEFVPPIIFAESAALIRSAQALLVVGSSLVVNSGIRVLELAHRRRLPIVIVNRGPTKGDGRATVKLESGTTEALTALRDRLAA